LSLRRINGSFAKSSQERKEDRGVGTAAFMLWTYRVMALKKMKNHVSTQRECAAAQRK